MDENTVRALSKGVSSLLRHNEGNLIAVGPDGYASVDDVVRAVNATRRPGNLGIVFDAAALAEVVAHNDKARYEVSGDGLRIRAVSGHSFPVDLGNRPYVPAGPLYFGTVTDKAEIIAADGMTGSRKLKVRLSDSLDAARTIAEKRGCGGPAVFEIDAPALARDGFAFEVALNGEILVDPFGPAYLTRVPDAPAPGA
jgi:putative RNA 2'-phosphotransferase